jgi:SAM-dependent methyltransferase
MSKKQTKKSLFMNGPVPFSDPEVILGVTKAYGFEVPEKVENILEIGCGVGGNVKYLADKYPDAKIVGIDPDPDALLLAPRADNVVYEQKTFQDYKGKTKFDVVICHAVLSYLTPAARPLLMKFIKRMLAPNGVAFVSYNTMPGWHHKKLLAHMMKLHGGDDLSQNLGFLKFMAESNKDQRGWWSAMLKKEFNTISESPLWEVENDLLADENHPLWFLDFCKLLLDADLGYVSDADAKTFLPFEYEDKVREQLEKLFADNRLLYEQYVDMLRNRTFRQSVIRHV